MEAIEAGMELYVPAGADLTRSRPYYALVLTNGTPESDTDFHFVRVARIRADGSPGKRRGKERRPFYAFLDRTRVQLRDTGRPVTVKRG